MIQLETLGRVRLKAESTADEGAQSAAQPKRLALLAYLALMSGGGTVRRDVLLALFWPELGDEEARRALRQALHYLRRLLGEHVLVGAADELSVSTDQFRCDAVEFQQLVAAGEPGRALSFYQGDFFAGFHVPDVSAEFEEWVDRTRARLRRQASAAAWTAAGNAEAAGQRDESVSLGRRACEIEPDQESGWRRLMILQNRIGDRAGALRTFVELGERLRREFDADPSAETAALAAKLRAARVPVIASDVTTLEDVPPVAAPAEAPPAAASIEKPEPARSKGRRWTPIAAAGGGILLLLAALMWRPDPDSRSEPSLIDAGAIAPSDRLLVAAFTDASGDTTLGVAIADAFRVDFAQSPNVRVMTPRQVYAALERMERSAELALNDSLARELALREGVKAFVVGRLAQIGGRWDITVELVGAEKGEAITAVRETAADSSGLIDAVDRASEVLRYRLGESLRDLRSFPPLAEEVTASLPALREYTEAMRHAYGSDRMRAIPHFEKAIAMDSSFAAAHLSLSFLYAALDEPGRAEEARNRAMAHLDRLPFPDRQVLIGSDALGRGDYPRSIRAYNDYIARFPNYAPAINNLALAYRDARQFAVAESLWARSIQVDSSIIALYFGLHTAQVLAGKFADARRTLDLIGRRSPGNSTLLLVEVQDAAAQQDWESAERRSEANIASKQGDTLQLVDAFEQLAGIVMTQGRLAEAERYWRTQLALAAASGSWGRRLYGAQMLGMIRLRFRRDTIAAVAVLDSALTRKPLDTMLPGDRPYGELARFFAMTGATARARAMMNAFRSSRPEGPGRDMELAWTEGTILLAEGRAREAEPLLRRAADANWCTLCGLSDLARAADARGDAEGAIQVWERYLTTPWLFRYEIDAYDLGTALIRLAELYEGRGDRTRAQAARTRLLALWRRADAELQPLLAEVRARVTSP
jgi:DNA-binding SARP family transcriptional activator/tetratricopeptide (TPR) repeat protein